MIKILIVLGTRPEVIKLAPVLKELRKYPENFIYKVCVTGQHRQMLDPLLKLFNIEPDYDLNIMIEDQSLEHITIEVLNLMTNLIKREKPDYLMVQGDTTTAMAASLSGFYQKVKIIHIEAGLRTWNKLNPYPEEINRKIIDSVCDLFFVPTDQNKRNLLQEGIEEENIVITGNTVIDALLDITNRNFNIKESPLEGIPFNNKTIILITAHRRENFGQPLINIFMALKEIARRFSDTFLVYPVHLNPNVKNLAYKNLSDIENILLTKPLDYEPFVQLMKRSYLILTDSGGLQEEAPSLGKPVLVLREITERIEVIKAGAAKLVGTDSEKIIQWTEKLLTNKIEYEQMAGVKNPYGDGKASKRIVSHLLKKKNSGDR